MNYWYRTRHCNVMLWHHQVWNDSAYELATLNAVWTDKSHLKCYPEVWGAYHECLKKPSNVTRGHYKIKLVKNKIISQVTIFKQTAINTLRPRENGRHFADDIFKCIFLNENVWIPIKISLKFVPQGPINIIPALVQIMAWRRPGDKPLSGPMIVRLPTHICVTRPQWVKHLIINGACTWWIHHSLALGNVTVILNC